MQEIKLASQMSQKAQIYKKEGNYDYAQRCYIKVVKLLGVALKQCKSLQQIENLKHKIQKYKNLAQQAQQNHNKKCQLVTKVSKFKFPEKTEIANNLFVNNGKQNVPMNNKSQINYNRQSKKNLQRITLKDNKVNDLNPEISKYIVRNIDVSFDDIVGMSGVKKTLIETVIRPKKRPDLCEGIRSPARGILLYGPPGNGKTFIGKALAHESGSTFIALSSSAIMNKFVGQAQKILRKIFQAAYQLSPSIVFIDEIDSLLSARSENENQASRRVKTQFLVLLDGILSPQSGNMLLIGATNLPDEIDFAAKRRFQKHIYVGLPQPQALATIITKKIKDVQYSISNSEMKKIVSMLKGYSASEVTNIVKEVCLLPLSQLSDSKFLSIKKSDIRKVNFKDFEQIIKSKPPLLTAKDLQRYQKYSII